VAIVAREAAAALDGATIWERTDDAPGATADDATRTDETAAIATWEARAADLRARRDRLATDQAAADATRREIEARRARAEATVAMDEERIVRAERDAIALAEREERIAAERGRVGEDLAGAVETEMRAAAALAEVRAADTAARDRLTAAERGAVAARERLRAADDRLRAADRADLEARLGRDALREQLLVELAGLGDLGRLRLVAEAGVVPAAIGPGQDPGAPAPSTPSDLSDESYESDEAAALESALDTVAARWAERPPAGDAPSPGRLAHLRRRYHELGAANPFAVEEHETVRQRLETLDTQQRDLRSAIEKTRQLIAELNMMIADQFRTTFAALETAFGIDQADRSCPASLAKSGVTSGWHIRAVRNQEVSRPIEMRCRHQVLG